MVSRQIFPHGHCDCGSANKKNTMLLRIAFVYCCCCLPTPLTFASGGGSDLPTRVPPASSFVTPVGFVQKDRGDTWVIRGDGCVLVSNLCKYDLRKGDIFVLTWARV